MTQIGRGAHASLPEAVHRVRMTVGWNSGPDPTVGALLLTDARRIRSDADVVAGDRSRTADGSVTRLGRAGRRDFLVVDFTQLPREITTVLIVASAAAPVRMDGLYAEIADDLAGDLLVRFELPPAPAETSVEIGEFRRVGAQWAFRAVGEGREQGLAGVVADHAAAPAADHRLDDLAAAAVGRFGLGGHRAHVVACIDPTLLDGPGSDWVDTFCERAHALARQFGDDACDVIRADLGVALGAVQRRAELAPSQPTLALFACATEPSEPGVQDSVRETARHASFVPLFASFLLVGETAHQVGAVDPRHGGRGFPLVTELEQLPGRKVDNVDYVSAADPRTIADDHLFDIWLAKYAWWLPRAERAGVLGTDRADAAGAAERALEQRGLAGRPARVVLLLSVDFAPRTLDDPDTVQHLCERVQALAAQLAPSTACPVFVAGQYVQHAPPLTAHNVAGYVQTVQALGSAYGNLDRGMQVVRDHVGTGALAGVLGGPRDDEPPEPVLAVVVTNAEPFGPDRVRDLLVDTDRDPVHWQFVCLGEAERLADLARSADPPGRDVTNSDTWFVADPRTVPDDELYGVLLDRYSAWLQRARRAGVRLAT